MPDELRRYYSPIVPEPSPEQFADEEGQEQEQPQKGDGKWNWIGSSDRPEAKESSDGISDLFQAVDQEEIDNDIRDLTEVDAEEDIIDADEDGTLDSLTEVSESDIMGDGEDDEAIREVPRKQTQYRISPRARRPIRYVPPTSMSGTRG